MAFKLQAVGIQGVENRSCNVHNARSKDDESNENLEKEGFKSFTQDTTLHGARFLFVNNILRRVIWSLALISCFTYCGYQVYSSLRAFYDHPFHTTVTENAVMVDNALPFPAVTLCNVNPLNTRRFRSLYKDIYNKTPTEERLKRKLQDISLMLQRSKEVLTDGFRKRNPELFQRDESVKHADKLHEFLSHQIYEMLLPSVSQVNSCFIDGLVCRPNNFNKRASFTYGQCYTLNSAEGENPLLNATLSGKDSGLKLRLNVERDSYLGNPATPTVGLTVIIHDQKSFPFMEEFGRIIQPGFSTVCAIKRRKIINLPYPYATNCTRRALANSSSIYAYTKQACLRKCRNDYTFNRCGCTPPGLNAKAPICAVNDTLLCVFPSHEKFGISKEKQTCEINCPEPCEQVEYETSFSYGGLQRDALIEHLMTFLNGSSNSSVGRAIYEPLLNMTKFEREKYIDDNIISLDIYFENLAYEVVKQTPVYETWTLIGNLGGTFGLFLGMSCLTLLELLDFIFRRMCHLCIRQKIGNHKRGVIHVSQP